jgi:hypothetical protein
MNEHVATYPTEKGVESLYITPHPSIADEAAWEQTGAALPKSRTLTLPFRRIALGVSFDPLFVTVIGERTFTYDDRVSTVHIVLDEALDTEHLNEWLDVIVALKDRHRATAIYCPNEPKEMVNTLQRTEGVTRYEPPHIDQVARAAFPSFVSFDLTAAVVGRDVPAPEAVGAALNSWLGEPVIDPRTNTPMIGGDAQPVHKLCFLDDFPMFRTMHAVRTATPGGATACYLALGGLEQSSAMANLTSQPRERAMPVPNRNPSGY